MNLNKRFYLFFVFFFLCLISLSCVFAENESDVQDNFISQNGSIQNSFDGGLIQNIDYSSNISSIDGNNISDSNFSSNSKLVSLNKSKNIVLDNNVVDFDNVCGDVVAVNNSNSTLEHVPPSCDSLDDGELVINNSYIMFSPVIGFEDVSSEGMDNNVNSIVLNSNPTNSISFNNKSKVITHLVAYDFSQTYLDNGNFQVRLLDSEDKVISGKNISFNLSCNGHNNVYSRLTDDYGYVNLLIELNVGTYNIQTKFKGDENYGGAYVNNIIAVNKANSYLGAHNFIFNYKCRYFQVNLTNRLGEAIVGETVDIDLSNGVNHKTYYDTTDSKGIARLQINLNPHDYYIICSFRGNTNYLTAPNSYSIIHMIEETNKLSTSLFVVNNTINRQGDNFVVRLLENNGVGLAGGNISFTIINIFNQSNVYSALTDVDGYARLSIGLIPGNWRIVPNFTGSFYYDGASCPLSIINQPLTSLNQTGTYFNCSNLTLKLSAYNLNSFIFYSFDDGITWSNATDSVSFLLANGNWTIKYYGLSYGVSGSVFTSNFIVDNEGPISWASIGSGIYTDSFYVNLTSLDDVDENPLIYYTLDGSLPNTSSSVYIGPLHIGYTSTLRFVSIDKFGNYGPMLTCNYFINETVANLNNGYAYSGIQEAINDNRTLRGHIIEVASGNYTGSFNINKRLHLRCVDGGNVILNALNLDSPIIYFTSSGNIIV